MQIIQSQQNIVEKVIRDKEGRLVRARFAIYESAGRIKARLIDFVYIAEQTLLNGAVFALNGFSKIKKAVSQYYKNVFSYNLTLVSNSLYFNGSKPRAPTFI
ncbi:MAG: hypothetical protein V4690_01115 [Patescibacteria group bacterium]